jgi:dolichol-phosphate mannosyltransferase
MISIVVPAFNEEANVAPLYEQIHATLTTHAIEHEIIFVNDGSSDGTAAALARIAQRDPRVKVINFRRNHGQTAALMAGFDHASGEVIVPMDGDLQNDPADIPRLLAKLDEGYSVVSGWRWNRRDSKVRRTLPSRAANWLISRISGVHLHDYGCTLKAYRREAIRDVRLYGEMHRFIPIYASWNGARVTEIPVNHFPRVHGRSHYGASRAIKVILDLIVVKFLEDYNTKPIYVFGMTAVALFAMSLISGLLAVYLRLFADISFISTPLPLLTALTLSLGVLFILLGLQAEILIRVYYEAQDKPTYLIRDSLNFGPDADVRHRRVRG